MKSMHYHQRRALRAWRAETLECRTMLTTLFVDGQLGDDLNPGTAAEPFASISAAVAALDADGMADTIEIAPGEYTENIEISHSDPLTLRGASMDGEATVIIGADAEETVVDIRSGDVTLDSLVVIGSEDADAISGRGDSLSLVDVQAKHSDRGVDVRFAEVTITRGLFTDNASDGIRVRNVQSFTATGVQSNRNGDEGIQIDNEDFDSLTASVTILGGDFSRNVDDGIAILDVASITLHNLISSRSTEGDGLDVELSLDDDDVVIKPIQVEVHIVGGDFSHNADEGAEFDNCEFVSVLGGRFSFNGDEGIDIDTTASAIIEYATVMKNGGSGLQVEAGDSATMLSIHGGFYSHNVEHGITVENAGDVVLMAVKGIGNGQNGLRVWDALSL